MMINVFAAPFTSTTARQELLAEELFIRIASEPMNGDVDCATTAIEDHDHSAFNHLVFELFFRVFPALDASPLGLKAQEKVMSIEVFDYTGLNSCLTHEVLVLFRPQGWHSEDPSDLSAHNLAYLL